MNAQGIRKLGSHSLGRRLRSLRRVVAPVRRRADVKPYRASRPTRPSSSPTRVPQSLGRSSGAPTLIWQTLEHAEKIECLDVHRLVAPLLYDANAKNREIAAWWLRRRMLGVFGPGEVYQQTLTRSRATRARRGARTQPPRRRVPRGPASNRSPPPSSKTPTPGSARRRPPRSGASTTTAPAPSAKPSPTPTPACASRPFKPPVASTPSSTPSIRPSSSGTRARSCDARRSCSSTK